MAPPRILVQAGPFDAGAELALLAQAGTEAGALASFVGIVRSKAENPLTAMVLEHYPAMTEPALARIAADATLRFSLLSCTIIHRFGRLVPGEPIVFAGAAAPHRRAALDAVSFLMDWLKTKAPFWKQEFFESGEAVWVDATAADDEAAASWSAATRSNPGIT
jgi:molybdopterin synthase catalytic subunit